MEEHGKGLRTCSGHKQDDDDDDIFSSKVPIILLLQLITIFWLVKKLKNEKGESGYPFLHSYPIQRQRAQEFLHVTPCTTEAAASERQPAWLLCSFIEIPKLWFDRNLILFPIRSAKASFHLGSYPMLQSNWFELNGDRQFIWIKPRWHQLPVKIIQVRLGKLKWLKFQITFFFPAQAWTTRIAALICWHVRKYSIL